MSRTRALSLWFAILALTTIVSLAFGAAATPGTWSLLLLISLMPAAILLMLWREGPPQTVAEVLYAVRNPEAR